MQYQRIRYLLDQYISGSLTEIEQMEWSSILKNTEYEQYIQQELRNLLELSQEQEDPLPETAGHHPILDTVLSIDKRSIDKLSIDQAGKATVRTAFLRPAFWKPAAAALVLLAAGTVGYQAFHTRQEPGPAALRHLPAKGDIAPGSNQAVLTLAGGKQILLTGAQNGLLSRQGNTRVVKLAGGRLAYEANGASSYAKDNEAPLYNTIATPRGGQYQITLPDGTRVWLNAATSLRFPAAFTDKERSVEITGEAYFEVAADKDKPFIVRAGQTQTRVLGTHFDIMAYGDEKAIKTTLLEGSVSMEQGGLSTLLHPGEQGAFDPDGGTPITKKVNVGATIAWKDGYYYFDRTKMEDVMRQIARWYNVDIVYQGAIPQDEIVGKIPRTAYVSEVLHIMELIGIRFKIEGRKITVLS
jgi:transmembrane sensor